MGPETESLPKLREQLKPQPSTGTEPKLQLEIMLETKPQTAMGLEPKP